MKETSKWKWVGVAAATLALGGGVLWIAGCQSAPGKLERKLFDIETNLVARVVVATNVAPSYTTNTVVTLVTNRNADGSALVVPVTNAAVEVTYSTNRTVASNLVESYVFTPNSNAAHLQEAVGRTATLFGPFGELASLLAGGAIALWGYLRSTRAAKLAGVLAQVIETGRLVLKATPQGQAVDAQWKAWMIQHQAEQGVIQDVCQLLANVVDDTSAREAADRLLALMKDGSQETGIRGQEPGDKGR